MSEIRGYCTLCRSRCGAVYTVDNGSLVGVRPDPDHPTGAALCPKGRAAPEIAHSTRRLTRPMRRTTPKADPDPSWQEISWDEAMAEITTRLGTIRDTSGPESVAFSVTSPSGTPMSDSIDWVERFIRLFGSPNICYATEICNWHKDVAHSFTLGTGLPTPDFAATDLAVMWGHNPAKSWLAQSAALATARARGTRLAVVDPTRSATAAQADHWLRVRPGTDAALALGVAHQLIERGDYDQQFVRMWTNAPLLIRTDTGRFLRAAEVDPDATGYVVWNVRTGQPIPYDTAQTASGAEEFALHGVRRIKLRSGTVDCIPAFQRYASACSEWPLARTTDVTTVDSSQLVDFIDELSACGSVCYATWSGVGQGMNATQTDRAIATLFGLFGRYDAPGGNLVLPKQPTQAVTSPTQLSDEQRAKALGADTFPLGPPSQGWITAREMCAAMLHDQPYRVRGIVSFGGNLLLSQPDPRRTAEALRRTEFSVHLDMFMNPTAQLADVVLPVTSPWEHEAIRTGFEITTEAQERVQLRPKMVQPVGEARSDTEVVFDLAQRLGLGAEFFEGDIESGWNHQLAPLGITVDDLRASPGGIRIPLTTQHRKYATTNHRGETTGFATPTRRLELYSEMFADHGYAPVPQHQTPAVDMQFPLTLTCAKNGHFCHSQHRSISSLRLRSPEPTVLLGERIAAQRAIVGGDTVEIVTRNGAVRMCACIDTTLHPDVIVAEHGWWENAPDLALPGSNPLHDGGANYNLLIDDEVRDPISGSVPMRSVPCDIRTVPSITWSDQRKFTVTAVAHDSVDVTSIQLRPTDDADTAPFRPGQHITIATPANPDVRRCYSLAGPTNDDSYTVVVRRVAGGELSPELQHQVGAGSELLVTAPSGLFTIPTHHSRAIVLIAGGIGISPFLGYLETVAACGSTVPTIQLHHVNRSPASHPFADRIDTLNESIPNLTVFNYYSSPDAPNRCTTKNIQRRITAQDIDTVLVEQRALFYLCGPESMLNTITDGLHARGVPRFDLFAERFHSPPPQVTIPDDAQAQVYLARTNRKIHWKKADGTILQLAEREGIPLPSGCRVGQCESCAISVLEGATTQLSAPRYDLPPDTCLTCQSIPATDLTLDG